jgi:hypothetical protein
MDIMTSTALIVTAFMLAMIPLGNVADTSLAVNESVVIDSEQELAVVDDNNGDHSSIQTNSLTVTQNEESGLQVECGGNLNCEILGDTVVATSAHSTITVTIGTTDDTVTTTQTESTIFQSSNDIDVSDKLDVIDELGVSDKLDVIDELGVSDKLDVIDELGVSDKLDVIDELGVSDKLDVIDELDIDLVKEGKISHLLDGIFP